MNTIDTFIEKIENSKSMGDYETALKIALEGLQSSMNDYRLYEELADIYLFQWNLDKAEEVIHYARELHPGSGTGMFLDGYISVEKGDYSKALTTMTEANKLFPNNAEILQNIGWCHVMLGDLTRGIVFLRRAHSLEPEDKVIANKLTTALLLSEEQNSHSIS